MASLLALALPGLALAAPPVSYELRPVLEAGKLSRLQVEMRLVGDLDGVTDMRLPDRWAGETELHRHLSGFAAEGAEASRPGPALLRLRHKPGALVTLRYQVGNGRGPASTVDYRPDLGPDGFTVLGEAVFAWPVGRLTGAAVARVSGAPADWRTATDLGRAATVGAVLESVTTAGRDVTLETRGSGPEGLIVALRGRFRFKAGEAADRLARILASQRAAYGEPAGPFLAVFQGLPEDLGRYTRDGVGRGDAAAYFISSDEYLEMTDRIVAHEPVHAWLPRKVGGLPRGAQEPAGYWFSEGFSDFVALRSLARAGLVDLEGYVSQVDRRVDADAGPGDRAVPNAELVAGYGVRRELFQAPYRRGLALAVLWDSRLREATDGRLGVDDVLRAMRARAAKSSSGPTADVLFPRVYRELGGPDLTADIAAHVRDGRPIVWPKTLYGGCLTVEPVEVLAYDEQMNEITRPGGRGLAVREAVAPAELARCQAWVLGFSRS